MDFDNERITDETEREERIRELNDDIAALNEENTALNDENTVMILQQRECGSMMAYVSIFRYSLSLT